MPSYVRSYAAHFLWYLWYALSALLAVRFALKLFGAEANSVSAAVYTLTAPVLAPVFFVFGKPRDGTSVLEWNTLLVIALYWAIAWGLVRFLVVRAEDESTVAS